MERPRVSGVSAESVTEMRNRRMVYGAANAWDRPPKTLSAVTWHEYDS